MLLSSFLLSLNQFLYGRAGLMGLDMEPFVRSRTRRGQLLRDWQTTTSSCQLMSDSKSTFLTLCCSSELIETALRCCEAEQVPTSFCHLARSRAALRTIEDALDACRVHCLRDIEGRLGCYLSSIEFIQNYGVISSTSNVVSRTAGGRLATGLVLGLYHRLYR